MQSIRNVAVIGLGYVGLPTAAVLARSGLTVLGVDVNRAVVDTVNVGRIHIAEHDLAGIVQQMVRDGQLRASVAPEPADVFMIAVPTPVNQDNTPNMTLVDAACAAIAPVLKKNDLVIIESTSTVGTTERAAQLFSQARPDLTFPSTRPEASDVLIAYCPERILPGATLRELVENARILGGLDKRSASRAEELYAHFVKGKMILSHARVAEMSKLTENAFRDVNIAFANELSMVCEELDINVWSVIEAANLHPRVNILQPGAGVGGHCIPVDPWFIINQAPDTAKLMRAARVANHEKTHRVACRIADAAVDPNSAIALLGLSYKPDVDDLRESPSLEILEGLLGQGFSQILVVEPNIETLPTGDYNGRVKLVTLSEALAQAKVVAILVNHAGFRAELVAIRQHPLVIDPVGALQ